MISRGTGQASTPQPIPGASPRHTPDAQTPVGSIGSPEDCFVDTACTTMRSRSLQNRLEQISLEGLCTRANFVECRNTKSKHTGDTIFNQSALVHVMILNQSDGTAKTRRNTIFNLSGDTAKTLHATMFNQSESTTKYIQPVRRHSKDKTKARHDMYRALHFIKQLLTEALVQ